MATGRRRAALLGAALLATALPLTAQAVAPHLTCGPRLVGRWEVVPVRAFQPVSGLPARDAVTAFGLDPRLPEHVAVTNGVRVQVSDSQGCAWRNGFALTPGTGPDQPFLGSTSQVVSVAELGGHGLAAVRAGTGSASQAHVLRETGGSWVTSDTGLPLQGAPGLLRAASDGHTAYLTISPNATGGNDDGTTAGLLTGGPPTGLLYGSTDGGASWSLRTPPGALGPARAGFDALVVDTADPASVYALSGGRLLASHDGGASFLATPGSGYVALTPMQGDAVAAVTDDGRGVVSYDGGLHLTAFAVPAGATSVAWRAGEDGVLVESGGVVHRVSLSDRTVTTVPTPARPRPGSLVGDVGVQSSYHALAGHALLRYVDPLPPSVAPPALATGDLSVTPPRPGVVSPTERALTLPVGGTGTAAFSLDLPRNPTPLDLFFLVDVSDSMQSYIDNLRHNIHKVVDRLTAAKVDLKVGVGTLGTAPAQGEPPYPDSYVYQPTVDPQGHVHPGPTYRKPRVYERIRPVGDTGPTLRRAIDSIQLETDPPSQLCPGASGSSAGTATNHEGQLLALEQMVTGSGVQSEQDVQARLGTYSEVPPGQEAGFRANPDVRRIVVLASDERFDAPYGTPTRPGSTCARPILDFRRTLRILNAARVGVFGITAGSPESKDDLDTLARGTRTFSPPGGVSCGGDPEEVLRSGAPLVCSQDGDFSAIIGQVLASLSDVQAVSLQATPTPVLQSLDDRALRRLDVKQDNRAAFGAAVSCRGVAPGTYAFDVLARLRGFTVGTARVQVTCVAALAAVPPVPLAPVPPRPPVPPAVQPPVPPPPPPPAAQPNPQPNANLNPLAAGVTQEQQEAQLALALNQAALEEQQQGDEQLAMVDRRRREQVQAFGSLLVAMTAAAALGLARLRARTVPEVRRAR